MSQSGEVPLPAPDALADVAPRVQALHAFANHELLAIELFALALLRFPDADPAWRRDVVRTIAEEQKHLRDYLRRIEALGGRFGDHPVSGYFWRCLSGAQTVDAFVAGMSLTLEQANLDFALSWRDAFAEAGDVETAALLQGVYDDEVRHVARGVAWFERDGRPLGFDAWSGHLPWPLSPTRARGGPSAHIIFDAAGRAAAGLSEDYTRRLRLHASTRGRAPTLWDFDMHVETRALGEARAPICDDLAPLAMFFASEGDLVFAEPPSDTFRLEWVARGLPPCAFLPSAASPADGAIHRYEGWAPGERSASGRHSPSVGVLGDKTRLVALRQQLYAEGLCSRDSAASRVLSDPTTLSADCEALAQASADGQVLLKAPLGTAGRGQRRVRVTDLSSADQRWIARTLLRDGSLLMEPLRDRLADITALIDTSRKQPVLAVRLAHVSRGGRFLGHTLGPRLDGLPPELQRALRVRRDGNASLFEQLRAVAARVATELRASGHRGPAGVDAFLYRDHRGEVQLQPLCEVNARRTLGHVALKLEAWVAPGKSAAWRVVTRAEARRHGGLDALCAILLRQHPSAGEGRICHGIVPVTDPACARAAVALLSVADTAREAWERLDAGYSRP